MHHTLYPPRSTHHIDLAIPDNDSPKLDCTCTRSGNYALGGQSRTHTHTHGMLPMYLHTCTHVCILQALGAHKIHPISSTIPPSISAAFLLASSPSFQQFRNLISSAHVPIKIQAKTNSITHTKHHTTSMRPHLHLNVTHIKDMFLHTAVTLSNHPTCTLHKTITHTNRTRVSVPRNTCTHPGKHKKGSAAEALAF